MSLLDKATIITTPTAHGNGVLHSIKGGAVADFDVVRGSAATRVNAEGLIEDISTLSAELVTNGDFSTDSNWTKGTGFSINSGSANCDGTQTANTEIKQQGGILGSTINFVVGKTYKVNFDIIVTSGQISNIEVASGYDSNAITTSGNHTTYITAVSTNNRFTITASPSFVGSIDNVSVVEVIDATNIPRIDYTDGTASILLEPQSTNLLPYSEDFSNASWAKNGDTVVEGGYLAPDGTNNAYKVSGTDNALTFNLGVTNGLETTTRSIYARTTSGTGQANLCSWNGNTNNLFTITEQWQRFEITNSSSVAATSFYGVDFRGTTNLSEIILWGANATNDQNYATSYIPTSGAIATRLADSVTGAGDATTFNDSEGVLYAEMASLANDLTARRLTICDGSNNNRVL